ncbi:hypothetical protein GCM10009557_22600 [Virgisporangium ochraceum]|uniref:DUF218 domain-containing protein n=1 Tax=Virgisporangium ochraceum TaxID=65505 RepID=A0A8J3ZQ29_9ACTN|nr:YdcF family protein [Virgisporangium ochraceum]GIJ68314.1 hypothetical protein Voc01_032310 [Virgisporangium ochraceum]
MIAADLWVYEAVSYREYALEHGVPDGKILNETASRTTAGNVTLTRELLAAKGIEPKTVIVISRSYQQRRAYGTFRKLGPEVTAPRFAPESTG